MHTILYSWLRYMLHVLQQVRLEIPAKIFSMQTMLENLLLETWIIGFIIMENKKLYPKYNYFKELLNKWCGFSRIYVTLYVHCIRRTENVLFFYNFLCVGWVLKTNYFARKNNSFEGGKLAFQVNSIKNP